MTEHSTDSSPDSASKKTFPPEKSTNKNKADIGLPSPETGMTIDKRIKGLSAVGDAKENFL